jgi:hypothetical protein
VQVGGVAKVPVEDIEALRGGRHDHLRVDGGMLVGDVGVDRYALTPGEIPRHRPAVMDLPLVGKRCPSEDDKVPGQNAWVSGSQWW